MHRIVIPALVICVFVGVETFYRWATGLALTWEAVGYRVVLLTCTLAVSAWSARRYVRRGGQAEEGLGWTWVWLILGPLWVAYGAWRAIHGVMSGRISVATSTMETTWADNPLGFALAFGLSILVVALGLLVIAVGLFAVRDWIARRKGPAWP